MGGFSVFIELVKQSGVYKKSFISFLLAAAVISAGYGLYRSNPLKAQEAPLSAQTSGLTDSLDISLNQNGQMYVGKSRVSPEVFTTDTTYRYRYQVINNPTESIDMLQVVLTLPQAGSDSTVSHRFITNGVATSVSSIFTSPTTITYLAAGVTPQSQLSIEVEVPKNFVTPTYWFSLKEKIVAIPMSIWSYLSLGLPLVTFVVLLAVSANRFRSVVPSNEQIEELPSRLPPAMLGILLNGRITSRDISATFVDLARRGHVIIRQFSYNDFRFSRAEGKDKLEDFEEMLMSQIFGPISEKTTSDEINLTLSKEVFSSRVSEAFVLAYRSVNKLGFFYTNPLSLHMKYQLISLVLFMASLIGFVINIVIIPGLTFLLLTWSAMIICSLLIGIFGRGIPARTVYGDRELARWLSLRNYLTMRSPIDYNALSRDRYMRLLPYAMVMNAEAQWTQRFSDVPFARPEWYIASSINTSAEFANSLFPLIGYLSHALSATAAPSAR